MSIASRITSIEGHIEEDYNALERLGADLTGVNKNIENIASVVNDIYDKLPKVTGTGSDLSLIPTLKGALGIVPIGNCEQNSLPSEYQAVEYIDNSIDPYYAYINTGYPLWNNTNWKIEAIFSINVNYNFNAIFGFDDITDTLNETWVYAGGQYAWRALGLSNTAIDTFAEDVKIKLIHDNSGDNFITSVNDVEKWNTTKITNTSDHNLCFGHRKDGGFLRGKIYGLKLWSNNILVRDFIPCYRKSDNKVGMYDIVNNQFYTNADTSRFATEFTKGNDVLIPNPDCPQDIRVVTGDNHVVVQNKNFLPFTNQDFTIASVRFYVENGTLKLNGTASGNIYNNNSNFKTYFKFTLPAGTYYYFTQSIEKGQAYIKNYATDTTLAQNAGTFTLTEETKLYYSLYITNGTSLENVNYLAQLEKGTTYSEITPHQEQSTTLHLGSLELCKIGDYQDVITGSKDNWKVVRQIKKEVWNGTEEDWSTYGNTGVSSKRFIKVLGATSINATVNILCNQLIQSNAYPTIDNFIKFTADNICWLGSTSFDDFDLTQFKNYLSTNNLIVYYQLATPTEETITDTSLVQSLNELNDLMSYDGTTNIVITSNSANAQLTAQISALKGE